VRAAAVAGLAMALLSAGRAHAFCRTTTVKTPTASYDPVKEGGCWTQGVPVFWRNSCVGYNIQQDASKKVSYEDASNLLSIAFTRWTGATCPTNGTGRSRVSVDVRDLGPIACKNIGYEGGKTNQNVVIFRDETWAYDKSVLGLTTISFDRETGELFNADMEINMIDMNPIALRDPVEGRTYDFLSVVTHEAGHFLGMAHSDQQDATMYAAYDPPNTKMRTLTDDDVTGICSVYRPDFDRSVLVDKVTAARQCDPTPRNGLGFECPDEPEGSCSVVAALWGGTTTAIMGAGLAVLALARRLGRRR
jgi:hypothetical protein